MKQYIRTCQECGHEQVAKDPKGDPSASYLDAKCKKCKSEALDYGSEKEVP